MRSPRILVEMALTIALAFFLDELRVFQMPQGGTVSLGMLPIIILAFRRGPVIGIVAGAAFGVIDVLTPPVYIVHPVQLLLDYPIPYAAVGLAGVTRGLLARFEGSASGIVRTSLALMPGVGLAIALRYACHFMSGAIFFAEYAPAGQPVLLYSALYNLYVPISGLLCLVVAAVLIPQLDRVAPVRPEPVDV